MPHRTRQYWIDLSIIILTVSALGAFTLTRFSAVRVDDHIHNGFTTLMWGVQNNILAAPVLVIWLMAVLVMLSRHGRQVRQPTPTRPRLTVIAGACALVALVIFALLSTELRFESGYVLCILLTVGALLASAMGPLSATEAADRAVAGVSYLEVTTGTLIGAQPRLDPGRSFEIGQDEDNDLVLFDERTVEKSHLHIYFDQHNRPMLQALAPLQVNQHVLVPGAYPLAPDDQIVIGGTTLFYRARSGDSTT